MAVLNRLLLLYNLFNSNNTFKQWYSRLNDTGTKTVEADNMHDAHIILTAQRNVYLSCDLLFQHCFDDMMTLCLKLKYHVWNLI